MQSEDLAPRSEPTGARGALASAGGAERGEAPGLPSSGAEPAAPVGREHAEGQRSERQGPEPLKVGEPVVIERMGRTGRAVSHEAQTSELAARPGALMLDYLRARLDDTDLVRVELQEWLGELTTRPFGWRNWYDQSWAVLDGGIVAACSDPGRAATEGLLVDLPGRACAGLGDRLPAFLAWCLAHGKITRADFAIDDRAGLVSYDRIDAAVKEGRLIRRSSSLPQLTTGMMAGGFYGWTVYIGKRTSEAMVRIYDKAAEQQVAGPWVRVELELHKDLADRVCWEYQQKGSAVVIGELNRHLRFVERSESDSNQWRWLPATWWAELLGTVEPGPCLRSGEKPVHTVQRAETWLLNQCAPNFAMVLDAKGPLFMMQLKRLGRQRFTAVHYAALAAWFGTGGAGDGGKPVGGPAPAMASAEGSPGEGGELEGQASACRPARSRPGRRPAGLDPVS